MSTTAPRQLPATYEPTVEALHRLAVYVISPAQRLANGEIIMRPSPQGFSTFEFAAGRVVGVRADRLTIDDAEHPITSLRESARLVGIEPDVSQQEQFDVPPHGDLDEMLAVDAEAATALGDWYAFAEQALDALRADASAGDDATIVRIWPEHFDAAIDMGDDRCGHRATYGGSPGDGHHDQPYLYVSPWAGRIDGFFADPSFKGASLRYADLIADPKPMQAALRFLREARDRIRRSA
jgi:hypothetical protein